MKKTDKISYREKSLAELSALLTDLSRQLVETRSKLSLGSLKDTSTVRKIRYQIALISTLIKEKENDQSK